MAKKIEMEKEVEVKVSNTENYLKYILYTLVCTFICIFISTIFIIIIAVDNKNTNNNSTNSGNNTDNNSTNNETENEDYDISMFTEINATQFLEAFNGTEKQIIYIGRPDCGYCVAFLPTMQQAQEEFGYKMLYLDLNNVSSEDYTTITGLNDFLSENFGYTPMVLVVQNGKILSKDDSNEGWVGYSEYDTFKTYLQELGY